MSIAKKLLAFIVLTLVALVTMLGVSLYVNRQIKVQQDYISEVVLPSMRAFREITEYLGEYRRVFTSFQRVVGTPDEAKLRVVEDMESNGAKLEAAFAAYAKTIRSPEERALHERTVGHWKTYFTAVQESLPIQRSGDKEGTEAKRVVIRQAGADFLKAMREQVEYLGGKQDRAKSAMEEAQSKAATVTTVLIVVATLLLGGLGWELFRTSVPPLVRMTQIIERIRDDRNLALRLPVMGQDEVSSASRALNTLIEGFANDFRVLRQSGAELRAASNGLQETASLVSETVSTQSEVSSSIAAATEELTVSIHHVADRARDSRKESDSSDELARSGVGMMNETVAGIGHAADSARSAEVLMGELQTRAMEIEKVVGVIRGLADQTNLLALNAAIEAARAGEQGRGFAVVADEVRKLAENTTRATVSVTQSINNILDGTHGATGSVRDTVSSVSQGVDRTTQAGELMHQISHHARQAASMAEEISTALGEQTSAADSIAQQIEHLAHMAESNSDASDRTREAAGTLSAMAGQLNEMVNRYRLEG